MKKMKKVDIGNTTNSLTHYIGHQKADINTVIESQRKTTIKEKKDAPENLRSILFYYITR